MSAEHDLVVVGGNAGGLSAAVFARECGVQRVTILEPGTALGFPDVVGPHRLEVGYGESVSAIDADGDVLVVTTAHRSYRTRAVLVAERTARTASNVASGAGISPVRSSINRPSNCVRPVTPALR